MKPKQGDLYKVVEIMGVRFELRYGYYDEMDKFGKYPEPIPIYPDLKSEPVYAEGNIPIVTAMQDVCEHFIGDEEGGCGECQHYERGEELFGCCRCPNNKRVE